MALYAFCRAAVNFLLNPRSRLASKYVWMGFRSTIRCRRTRFLHRRQRTPNNEGPTRTPHVINIILVKWHENLLTRPWWCTWAGVAGLINGMSPHGNKSEIIRWQANYIHQRGLRRVRRRRRRLRLDKCHTRTIAVGCVLIYHRTLDSLIVYPFVCVRASARTCACGRLHCCNYFVLVIRRTEHHLPSSLRKH